MCTCWACASDHRPRRARRRARASSKRAAPSTRRRSRASTKCLKQCAGSKLLRPLPGHFSKVSRQLSSQFASSPVTRIDMFVPHFLTTSIVSSRRQKYTESGMNVDKFDVKFDVLANSYRRFVNFDEKFTPLWGCIIVHVRGYASGCKHWCGTISVWLSISFAQYSWTPIDLQASPCHLVTIAECRLSGSREVSGPRHEVSKIPYSRARQSDWRRGVGAVRFKILMSKIELPVV